MTTSQFAARALVTGAVLLGLSTAQANLIQNGSFETPVVPVGFYKNFLAGSTDITGWTVVGIDSAVTSGSFVQAGITFQAQDGLQWVDLAGVTSNSKSSGITQSFATTVGTGYEITFYVGSATDNFFFFPTTVDLSINGGARTSYLNPVAPRNALNWTLFTVDFVAVGTTSTLTFYNGGEANNFNTALDNVSVNAIAVGAVPEPAESVLMLIGLASLAGLHRARARRRG